MKVKQTTQSKVTDDDSATGYTDTALRTRNTIKEAKSKERAKVFKNKVLQVLFLNILTQWHLSCKKQNRHHKVDIHQNCI